MMILYWLGKLLIFSVVIAIISLLLGEVLEFLGAGIERIRFYQGCLTGSLIAFALNEGWI